MRAPTVSHTNSLRTSHDHREHEENKSHGDHSQVAMRVARLRARIDFATATQALTRAVETAVDQVLVSLAIHQAGEFSQPREEANHAVPDVTIECVGECGAGRVQPAHGGGIQFVEAKTRAERSKQA